MAEDDTKKKVFRGVKKALKKVLEDVEGAKANHASFKDAIYSNLDEKTKGIIDSHKEKVGEEEANCLLADAIAEAGGDDLLGLLVSNMLGLDLNELKEAAEYVAERTKYQQLLGELSKITRIKKTNLILSIDYSKDVTERIAKLETFLQGLVKKRTEV